MRPVVRSRSRIERATTLRTKQSSPVAWCASKISGVVSSRSWNGLSLSGLLERLPAPGSRRDHYRFPDGAWARLMSQQNQLLATMVEVAEQGLAAAGDPATPAGRRLAEMGDSYAFLLGELPPLIDRWRTDFKAKREAQ